MRRTFSSTYHRYLELLNRVRKFDWSVRPLSYSCYITWFFDLLADEKVVVMFFLTSINSYSNGKFELITHGDFECQMTFCFFFILFYHGVACRRSSFIYTLVAVSETMRNAQSIYTPAAKVKHVRHLIALREN